MPPNYRRSREQTSREGGLARGLQGWNAEVSGVEGKCLLTWTCPHLEESLQIPKTPKDRGDNAPEPQWALKGPVGRMGALQDTGYSPGVSCAKPAGALHPHPGQAPGTPVLVVPGH